MPDNPDIVKINSHSIMNMSARHLRGGSRQGRNPNMTNPAWKSIADAAPTLNDLKQLSFERQVMLLLARLNVLYPQMANTGGLHRENLRLDGYDLAIGYGPSDKKALIEYLLGRPWMELVHRCYLLETSPNFYRISEDGVAALNNSKIRSISRA